MKARILKVLAMALVSLMATAAASSAASSHKFSLTGTAKLSGTQIHSSKCTSTLGSCSMSGHVEIPDTIMTWHFRGGSLNVTGHGTTGAADHGLGTWKVTGGSGKFRHASGRGSFAGYFHTGTFTYKGTIKY